MFLTKLQFLPPQIYVIEFFKRGWKVSILSSLCLTLTIPYKVASKMLLDK
jgi:hypothetical protein